MKRRIAYVTASIPVELLADNPVEDTGFWKKAAIENFLDHPVIRQDPIAAGMEGDYFKIEFEEAGEEND